MINVSLKSTYPVRKVFRTLIVLTIIIYGCGGDDAEPKITKVDIVSMAPASPANLKYGDDVQITYNYVVTEADGARIFIQGVSDGTGTTYYSPSPVYKGEGSKTVTVSVISDEPSFLVEQLRIKIVNPAQTSVISETFVDVSFTFSD
jgi:hypothetical protein